MKKRMMALLLAALTVLSLAGCSRHADRDVLNVYNWGEYISDGSDGSFDTIQGFEDWYEKTYGREIEVNYTTYPSNEDMYNKIVNGAVSYDVIIPSDYMVDRMRTEGLLLPLDYGRIPNAQYISSSFKRLYYDPSDLYSIPYTYGTVGIIYDAKQVDEADTGSWDLMWNEKYADNILQYNNSRDALGSAMYRLGIDINTTDRADWDRAAESLIEQRPLVKSYVMDEIFNMMESGEAAIGSYYAGDYFTMLAAQSDDVDLRFYYPEPTNYFVDAMCIPTCAQHKELAEIFINYMLSEEAAIANAEYISYASPNQLVYMNKDYRREMGEDAMEILYPDVQHFSELYNKNAYRSLDTATLDYLNQVWETVKIN